MRCARSSRRRGWRPSCSTASRSCTCCGRALTRRRRTGGDGPRLAGELLGELDAPVEREEAIQAGARLREAIAGSSLDFDRDSHLAYVDRDAEQTIVVATTAGRTTMGWLHGAMLTRAAVHASVLRARARAPPRAPAAEARLPSAVHDQPRRGVPRPGAGLRPLRAGARVRGAARPARHRPADGLFHVSIYEQLRARGPDPDLSALSEAVDFCSEQIESAGDCQGQRRRVPPAALVGERAAARARRGSRRYASTRPSTRRTCCRWSGRSAARRPGSRSRSPTPAAPSSC